jgi:hypothetical protein
MKRTILFLLARILLITFAVAFGLSREHAPPQVRLPSSDVRAVAMPEERAIEVITLSPVIITASVRRPRPAAVLEPPPPPPEVPELRCGAWRPLASDESQTVRYCESR